MTWERLENFRTEMEEIEVLMRTEIQIEERKGCMQMSTFEFLPSNPRHGRQAGMMSHD